MHHGLDAPALLLSWISAWSRGKPKPMSLTQLRSPLNVNHTSGPVREVIRDARSRFHSSAGPSTSA